MTARCGDVAHSALYRMGAAVNKQKERGSEGGGGRKRPTEERYIILVARSVGVEELKQPANVKSAILKP